MAKTKLTYKENKAFFKELSKELKSELELEIDRTTEDIVTDAISKVPVDLGVLRSRINGEVKELTGLVTVNANYAAYVEFGTGGLVDVPSGLEDYAIKFKGNDIKQVNITPKPFLYPSFFKNTNLMLQRINKLINGAK